MLLEHTAAGLVIGPRALFFALGVLFFLFLCVCWVLRRWMMDSLDSAEQLRRKRMQDWQTFCDNQ